MSVAGSASACARACAAAVSNALGEALAETELLSLPEDTAFMRPDVTVDFSACVAPTVRK